MNIKIEIAFLLLLLLLILKLGRQEVPIWLRFISHLMMKLSQYSKQLAISVEKIESGEWYSDEYVKMNSKKPKRKSTEKDH